jgi:hypothetical protein
MRTQLDVLRHMERSKGRIADIKASLPIPAMIAILGAGTLAVFSDPQNIKPIDVITAFMVLFSALIWLYRYWMLLVEGDKLALYRDELESLQLGIIDPLHDNNRRIR